MAVARTLSPRTPPHLVKLMFEDDHGAALISSGDELEDHIGFGPVRYTSSDLPARLARAQLSMRPCAPCVPPQHHDHDQDAHNAPRGVLNAPSPPPGATFARRWSLIAQPTGLDGDDHGSGRNQAAQARKSLRFGASQRHVEPITKCF